MLTGIPIDTLLQIIKNPQKRAELKEKIKNSPSSIIRLMEKIFPLEQLTNLMCMDFTKKSVSIGFDKISQGKEIQLIGTTTMPICQVIKDKNCNSKNYQSYLETSRHTVSGIYNTKRLDLVNKETNPDNLIKKVELTTKEKTIDLNKIIRLKKNELNVYQNFFTSFIPQDALKSKRKEFTTLSVRVQQNPRPKNAIDPATGQPLLNVSITFERDRDTLQIYKNFQKMDDILATIFGLYDLMAILFGIFFKIYNYKRYEYYLINKLYFCDNKIAEEPSEPTDKIKEVIEKDLPKKGNFLILS